MSNKKPTMMQVKNVINNILRQMSVVSTKLDQVDGIVNMYISFKKDRDSFKKYVDEQLKEKMQKVFQLLEGFKEKAPDKNMLQQVLKIQKLVKELKN